MKTKIIIVGQGISGTFLSWFLHTSKIDLIVIDDNKFNSTSRVAAGLINPVTGRRVVKVWLDDIIIPFAENAYREIGDFLSINIFHKTQIIDFFPNPFMKESFLKKLSQDTPYIQMVDDADYMKQYFNYEFGAGIINPGYVIYLNNLLPAWRKFLEQENKFIEEKFDFSKLKITGESIIYKDIEAETIIFCDGAQGNENPYFSNLPFALHKGEAILIEAPELPTEFIYKKSLTLAPQTQPGLFWVGTNYIWEYDNEDPTENFRKSTEQTLNTLLKVPYKIVDHKSAIRPATVERRPFVGFHPIYKKIGLLNGMGTKGCSLGPFFAYQLYKNIANNNAIEKEANVNRYENILKRSL